MNRWRTKRPGRLARAFVLASLVGALAACSSANGQLANPAGVQISTDARHSPFHGAQLATPYTMPDVTLTADDGQPFNLVTDTLHPVTLMFFGYTNCTDVCPLVLSDLTATYLELSPAVRAKTQVIFVTTDPARDTDAVLRAYLSRYNPNFLGLTGSLAAIKRAATALGVAMTGTHRLPSGGYDVGHGSQVIGFRGSRAPVIWTAGTPVPDMVADVTTLAGR